MAGDWTEEEQDFESGWEPDFDDVLVDPEFGLDPLLEKSRARDRVILRAIILFVLAGIVGYSVYNSLYDFVYLLQGDESLVELGDVRTLGWDDDDVLEGFASSAGAYVSMENTMIAGRHKSEKFNFYYDPLCSVIVRTARELPSSSSRAIPQVTQADVANFVQNKRFTIDVVGRHFDAKGRLIRADLAMGHLRNLAEQYNEKLGENSKPLSELWILLDEELPSGHTWFAVAYATGALLLLLSLLFFVRAVVVYRRVLRSM